MVEESKTVFKHAVLPLGSLPSPGCGSLACSGYGNIDVRFVINSTTRAGDSFDPDRSGLIELVLLIPRDLI